MSSTNTDQTIVLDTSRSDRVYAVTFHPDGKHVLGGSDDGIRQWRLSDGQEVAMRTGTVVCAISVSRDGNWIACGTGEGASVWDGEMHEKVIDVERGTPVYAVDVSPDSSTFATGTRTPDNKASVCIWSITTGKRLVGPLQHDNFVSGTRFSPNGEHVATTSSGGSIRVFDSRNGDELININTTTPYLPVITPLAWSSDGQQIFATSEDHKIRSFDVSTGSQLRVAERHIRDDVYNLYSIALPAHGKFIATFVDRSILFLDASTLSRTGPVFHSEDSKYIRSIAISQDGRSLATGRGDGKVIVRHLGSVLPLDLYSPSHVSTHEEVQHDQRPSTSGGPDSKEEHVKSSPFESEGHKEDGDDLLEAEALPDTPAQEFDYEEGNSSLASVLTLLEAPSLAPSDPREDEAPPLGQSHVRSDALPVLSTSDVLPKGNLDIVESPSGRSILKRWLQRKGNKGLALHMPDRLSGKSRKPADRRSPSHSPARVDDMQEGPSTMAPAISKIIKQPRSKSRGKTTARTRRNEGASRSGQGAASAREANSTQQATTNPSQPSPAGVHLTEQSGYATLAFTFPAWLLCSRSGTHDATH